MRVVDVARRYRLVAFIFVWTHRMETQLLAKKSQNEGWLAKLVALLIRAKTRETLSKQETENFLLQIVRRKVVGRVSGCRRMCAGGCVPERGGSRAK